MLRRVARNTAAVCVATAAAAWVIVPGRPVVALGVIGGGALVGLSFWAISGLAAGLGLRAENGEVRAVSRVVPLVKFFTRHAIIAFSGYVMIVHLHLDPIGMLIGVTSVVVAAAVEAVRRP
jgi:hypothetical protein